MTSTRRLPLASPLRVLPWIAAAALAILALAPASNASPPGNNGTVKIHEGSSHADPPKTDRNNQPHVCTFHIHGFGFDAANTGSWRIYDWPPTGSKSEVKSGTWSGTEWQSAVMTLPDGHYRLVVDIDGDKGGANDDDTTADKHKEFWVECAVETSPPSQAPSTSPSESPSSSPSHSAPAAPSHAPSTSPSASASTAPSSLASASPSHSAPAAPSHAPSTSPSASASTAPSNSASASASSSPSASTSVVPSGSVATPPTGGVEAATATPRLTPPATDGTNGAANRVGDLALRLTLLALAGLIVSLPMLATARRRSRR